MPKANLTTRSIAAIKPPSSGRVEYFDTKTPGFGLRISATGRVTWFLFYRSNGTQHRHKIGTYPEVPLSDARGEARDVLARVAKGENPAAEKDEYRKAETVRELGTDYIERWAKPRKRSWKKDLRAFERDIFPDFGNRKAQDITRAEVSKFLDKIVKRGAPIQANRVLEVWRKSYNWAIKQGILEHNPCQLIDKPGVETESERVFSDDEIRALWKAFEHEPVFKMILITGQRLSEVAGMRISEIDFDRRIWIVPGSRMKSKKPHIVPLSDMALDVIRKAPTPCIVLDHVFPSPRKRGHARNTFHKPAVAIREATGIKDFSSHHLRRTAGTGITALGFSRFIMDRVLGHLEPGVGRRYDRHDYLQEKTTALNAWGNRLTEIIEGKKADNVVSLNKSA